jgi:hypothetical protein
MRERPDAHPVRLKLLEGAIVRAHLLPRRSSVGAT